MGIADFVEMRKEVWEDSLDQKIEESYELCFVRTTGKARLDFLFPRDQPD
jgi:hypothetical protein